MPKGDDAPALPGFRDGELLPMPTKLVQDGFELWNEFARKNKWQIAPDLTSTYRAALKRAIPDYNGLQGMRKILEMVERSDFYMGRVPPTGTYTKPFRAKLTWFLRPKTVTELQEQMYNGGGDPPTEAPRTGRIEPVAMNWRAILETYKPGGPFWPAIQGRRPEEPGPHLAPAEFVEAWRLKYGVTGQQGHNGPPVESLEERLRASIEGYRRIGRYEDANRVENKLSALLGRPAVHVPSPEAASFGMGEMDGYSVGARSQADRRDASKTSGEGKGESSGAGGPRRSSPKAAPQSVGGTGAKVPEAVQLSDLPTVTDVSDEPPPWSGDDVPEGDYAVEADD